MRYNAILQDSIQYSVVLCLTKDQGFTGGIMITFSIRDLEPPCFLEFSNDAIQELKINGDPFTPSEYWDGFRIKLPKDKLDLGENSI